MLEWNNTVAGYIEEIRREKNPEVRERLMREYDARAYGARITRLESLNGSIDNELSKLYARANEQFRELLGENYTDGYYRTIFDIQNRFGYSSMFATVNAEVVENALSYPWSGANFSDRLWKQKVELLNNLRETLTTGFILGDSVQKMAKRLSERLDASRSNALRLIRTESSHIHNTAELDAYKECGFEEYEFMASLGERTCEVCGGMDGKRIKLTDKQFGVNFPPLHPNCRCTTIAFDPDDDLSDFKDRLENGELNYDKWYAKYVEGREQPRLESKGGAEIEVPENPVPVSPTSGKKTAVQTLTTGGDSGIIRSDREKKFIEDLRSGKINTVIDQERQNNHVSGGVWRNQVKQAFNANKNGVKITPKSRLFSGIDPQWLVDTYSGTGRFEFRPNSNSFDEFITLPFDVGVTFDKAIGKYIKTNVIQIKYSAKNGTHVFPTKEMKK